MRRTQESKAEGTRRAAAWALEAGPLQILTSDSAYEETTILLYICVALVACKAYRDVQRPRSELFGQKVAHALLRILQAFRYAIQSN